MDAITKESKEWLAALALVPEKYKAGMCTARTTPTDDYEFGNVWCPSCMKEFGCGNHDREVPDITPDFLYAILEVMVTKYRTMQAIDWEMNFEGRSFRDAIIRAAASLVTSLVVERD